MGDQSWAKTDDFSGGMDDLFADLMGGQSVDEMKADMAAQGVDVDASVANMGEDAAEAEAEEAAKKAAEEEQKAKEAEERRIKAATRKANQEMKGNLLQGSSPPGHHGLGIPVVLHGAGRLPPREVLRSGRIHAEELATHSEGIVLRA